MRIKKILCCFCLLLVAILAFSQPIALLAQDENSEETIEESIDISAKYPKVEITSGETAEFEVELKLTGEMSGEPRVFDLVATGPKDWYTYMTPTYPKDKKIASIELSPGFTVGENILVEAYPAYWIQPEAGNYTITLEATSGDIKGVYDLTVVVTAQYVLALSPTTERYNTSATAGRSNVFTIEVQNNGSAVIDNITFSSNKPEDWVIDFSPRDLDSIASGDIVQVDVNIKPPPRTIAGDYVIILSASGKQATADEVDIRVTVETPTIWGWVGVAIVVVVIAGIVYIFMRFSRR